MMSLTFQQLISDLLVLAGVAIAALSVLLAIIALARTRAPRGGAQALVLGIVMIAVGAWSSTQPMTPHFIGDAWSRVFSDKSVPVPAPVPAPVSPPDAATPVAPATGG